MAKDVSVIKWAFVCNLGIFIAKAWAALITGSAGLIAEAVHSLADSMNQVLLLIGAKRSSKKADDQHPFGYGMEEYFWSFVVGELLFVLGGIYSVYEGIHKILHPEPIKHVYIGFFVLAFGFLMESISWMKAYRELGKPKMADMFEELVESKEADTVVVFTEDTGALLGLSIAMFGTILSWTTGDSFWDALSSLGVGFLLFIMAAFLVNEMRKLLVGEAIDPVEVRYVRMVLNHHENVRKVGKIRTMQLGSGCCEIAVDVDFNNDLKDGDIDATTAELRKQIQAKIPEAKYIYIQPRSL